MHARSWNRKTREAAILTCISGQTQGNHGCPSAARLAAGPWPRRENPAAGKLRTPPSAATLGFSPIRGGGEKKIINAKTEDSFKRAGSDSAQVTSRERNRNSRKRIIRRRTEAIANAPAIEGQPLRALYIGGAPQDRRGSFRAACFAESEGNQSVYRRVNA